MLQVKDNLDPKKNRNAYVLFGWEAVQARPNLDPYTSSLRMNDETQQVYTSDVHIKHHTRRGIKRFAQEGEHPSFSAYASLNSKAPIFYEKEDDEEPGVSFSFEQRLELLRQAHGISKKAGPRDALDYCLDTPLFGYVHAVARQHFNVTNAVNTLFRPVTFHACRILPLGRNNAFPQEGAESAGSAVVDSLEYGFFLALWEINLSMLKTNASGHKVVPWDDGSSYGAWVELFLNGLWRAYTSDRYPSFTQRPQFAQFVVGWQPEVENHEFLAPQDLIQSVGTEPLTSHDEAMDSLSGLLPSFLNEWGLSSENEFVRHTAKNFTASLDS